MGLLDRYRQRRARAQEIRSHQQEVMGESETRRLRQELERQNAEARRLRNTQLKANAGQALQRGLGMLGEMKRSMSDPNNPRRPKIAQIEVNPRIKMNPNGMKRGSRQ